MTKDKQHINVPHLRFPEFTGEWKKVLLGQIANITKGNGISKEQLSDQGTPCILYGELYTKYKSEIINEIYSKTTLNSSALVKSQANDVIIPCSGETAIDISTARCVPYNDVLLGGDLNIIRLKSQNGGFFAYQLNGVRKHDIACIAQGVSVVHLYGENLKRIKVCYPSIEEQRKITSLLSLIDERIATQNKIIKKLETLIKAIGNKLLFGDEQNIRLGNILIERVEKSTTNNQYEVLSSTVKGIFSQRDYFSKDIASENNTGYKILRRGDIVLSPQNLWMGNINHNDKFDIGIVSPSYKIFTISEEFDCHYIAFLLKTRKALYGYMSVSEQGASVVRRNLNLEAFYELTYKIPHIAEQRRIGQILSKLKDKIESEQTYLEMLRAQKQYLLSNLFI